MNEENNNLNEEKINIIATIGSLIFTAFIVFGVMLVFASIMRPFGFVANSLFSIILYFTCALFVSYPLQKIAVFLVSIIMFYAKVSPKWAKIVSMQISIITNFISLYGMNYYMQSITTNNLAMLVISITIALLSVN